MHRALIFLALLVCSFFWVHPAQAQRFVVAEVTSIKGRPEMAHENFGRRLVIPGSAVYGNDVVKTDSTSSVVLGFFDGTSLKVGANSQLRITKYVYDAERSLGGAQLDLVFGQLRLWAERKLKGELLQIHSPNAVAGVRGTEFEMGYRPTEESSLVAVVEGKVYFFNAQLGRQEGVEIPKNYWGEVKGGKPPGEPKPLDQKPAGFDFINR